MPTKLTVDSKKLIKMVQDGTPRSEVMDAFGFKTSTQVNTAYMNALMDEGMVPRIKTGRRGSAKAAASKEVRVGKTGSVIISKDLVDEMGFTPNDRFQVKKTKNGISLKKL